MSLDFVNEVEFDTLKDIHSQLMRICVTYAPPTPTTTQGPRQVVPNDVPRA